jgi:WD40 repeat protein/serine/threonine protein kinase
LQKLGEGGMGIVYLAEQEEPVRRQVALKIIKAGMDSTHVIGRFEQERQALAMMDHPNIAKVLDAGTTASPKSEARNPKSEEPNPKSEAADSGLVSDFGFGPSDLTRGRPYFVMELVKGIPITKFCDQEQLTPRERLELLVPVCQAVQHAHQKGIIHRDLKPSNVLIALYDGKPVPKVIDFGVAKATGQKLTERTLFTEVGQMVGTLEYMAPEQAELNNLDIDTRADIYALGVILYELLTGSPPFTGKQLRSAAFAEMLRIIREVEPSRPSTKLSSSAELPGIAAKRKLEPKKLTRLMQGELDWIVMKCLEKERQRRYETANGLAMDIQRYLADEPVAAGPPSALYRFRKFARRHKGMLMTAAVVAMAVVLAVATLAVSTTLTLRANRELQQALDRERDTAERERQNAYYQRIALAEREWSANNLNRMLQLLDECPPDLRGWEWYYLHRLGLKVLPPLSHSEAVLHVAVSRDGQRLASASRGGFVTLWDAQTGRKLLPSFKAHEGGSPSVAFSPDGHLLATGGDTGDGTVVLWAAETGQRLRQLEGRSTGVSNIAFSPDGQRLTSVGWVESSEMQARGEMRIWDLTTGQRLLTIAGPEVRMMTCVAFSPDGQRLATGNVRGAVTIWDAQTGAEQRTFHGHSQKVHCVAFSPDGRLVASGGGQTIYLSPQAVKVWDSATGQELFTLHGHLSTIYGVAFSPDGRRLASASTDRSVKLWDLATGQETLTLRGHFDGVRSVAFSSDGRLLASASLDRTVRVWNAAPVYSEEANCLTVPEAGGPVTSVAFHPRHPQTVAAAYGDGRVRVWDLSSDQPRCVHILTVGSGTAVSALAFSRAGQWLAAVTENELKVWNATSYQEARTISGDPPFFCVMFSPDEKQVAAAGFGNSLMPFPVRLWDVTNDCPPRILSGNTWAVFQVAFRPDGRRLASTGADGSVRLWDVSTEKRIDTPPLTPTCGSYGLAFSPDGQQLAVGSNDQGIRVWDTTAWQLRHEYRDSGAVRSVAFSPDGRRLAWGSTDSTVKIWDLPNGGTQGVNPLIHTLHSHTNWVLSVAFSPDGRRIASASADGTVKIWKAPPVAEPPHGEAKDQDP